MSNYSTKLQMLKDEALRNQVMMAANAIAQKPVYNPAYQLSARDKARWTALGLKQNEHFKIGHKLLSINVPWPDQKLVENTPRMWQTFDEKKLNDDEKDRNYEHLICQVVRAMVIRNDLDGVAAFFHPSHPFYHNRRSALKHWYMAMDSWHDGTFNPVVESALWEVAYGDMEPYMADAEDFKNQLDWTAEEMNKCWEETTSSFLCLCAYTHVTRDQVEWFVHDSVFRYNRCAVFRNYIRAIRLARGEQVKQPEMKMCKEQDLWNSLFSNYAYADLAQHSAKEDLGTEMVSLVGDNDVVSKAKLEWLYTKAGRPPLSDREVFDIATAGHQHRLHEFVLTPDNHVCAIVGFDLAKEMVELEMQQFKLRNPDLFAPVEAEACNEIVPTGNGDVRMI